MVTINASKRNWKRMNRHKDPGDSMDDVLEQALDALEAREEAAET